MQLTVGQKIGAGYGIALLVMAIVGTSGYTATGNLIENSNWVTHTHQVLEAAERVVSGLGLAESATRGYLLTGEDRYLDAFQVAGNIEANRKLLGDLTSDNASQQARLNVLKPLIEQKLALMKETIELRKKAGFQEALKLMQSSRGVDLMTGIQRQMEDLETAERELLHRRDLEAKASAEHSNNVLLYGSLAGLALVVVVGVAIHRSITGPLAVFKDFVAAIGEGDLTRPPVAEGADELGRLGSGLNRMVEGLRDVSRQTRAAAANVSSAVLEIMAAVKQQASSASEQAAACQETGATMQQVSQSCVQMSERAKSVLATAEAAFAASNAGAETVQATNRSMESIREQAEAVTGNVIVMNERTQLVGEIVDTANEIAEQSHLLALNAAIEAANAGEHGRSFAIVASEIKNLATQSKSATVQARTILDDIKRGINTSVMLTEEAVKRVETGKAQSEKAARAIREMTASIELSVQAFQQIQAGTNQQQIGYEHVLQAVKDIGQSSTLAADSTRQMEKAAVDLAALAGQLRKATERYRL